ncbi:MerR family DNA-binding transcriptional regulator [Streptomyces sp. TRM66268-LWL]|uniref:MerR family DNA-binding transcriptional regulator n=1 Tax=Streptomyces polyasparticus TaxID=2767826 RepID=A0ABR7SC70_9ACTN|nr:MerR family transcriptional regulator [Streptomyces polyasparticus]MBC9712479.1 MerR family DNA-binding transcriptional regulator [Streptomyces polyasparticus]
MRIGEIAALAGVTPRAVRHYHHLGLLPEPDRLPNGYRDYGVRHAVALARIRRLTELGLGLPEVRDVLADDEGRELAEVLEELDADLARQEAAIEERRARLRVLLEQARAGTLPAEGPVSPGLAELLSAFSPSGSASAAKDREHLTLIDSMAPPEDRDRMLAALRPLADDPELAARIHELYVRLDALADAGVADPRIGPLAADFVAAVPRELLDLFDGVGDASREHPFGQAMLDDFAPAQAAVVRQFMTALAERGRNAE